MSRDNDAWFTESGTFLNVWFTKMLIDDPSYFNYLRRKDIDQELSEIAYSIDAVKLFEDVLVKDSCLYYWFLADYCCRFKKLPSNIILTQDLVNELVLVNPNFTLFLIKNNLYQYLTDFVLEVYVACGKHVRLSMIPENLLNEKLILLALSKSDKSVLKLGNTNITEFMKNVSKKHRVGDRELYDNTMRKINIIRKTYKEQENKEIECRKFICLIPKFLKYFSSESVSVDEYCEANNIPIDMFKKLMSLFSKYNRELVREFEMLNNVYEREFFFYINNYINSLAKSVYNGVKSPEKNEIIPFNVVLYYIYYGMDFNRLLRFLSMQKRYSLIGTLLKKINYCIIGAGMDEFFKNKTSFDDVMVTDDEKKIVENFMVRHNMPLTTAIATLVLVMFKQGHILLDKTYDKLEIDEYDTNQLDVITKKINDIKLQESVIETLTHDIGKIKNKRKELMLQW